MLPNESKALSWYTNVWPVDYKQLIGICGLKSMREIETFPFFSIVKLVVSKNSVFLKQNRYE